MTNKLFENFLDCPAAYEAAERFWADLVENVTRELGQTGEWPRWIDLHYADGTRMEKDGNPIYDGRSQRLDRGFVVIQHTPVGDDVELAAWLKHYDEEFETLPRDELVINTSLSTESAALARRLLREWMTPTTTPSKMLDLIHAVGASGGSE